MSPKAFAVARRATADVSRTSSIPSARPSRRHLQGAFMAGGKLYGPAPHLLRTCARTSTYRQPLRRQVNLASDSYFPALRNQHSPVSRSRHTKVTFLQS